ncbi:hypothetical protein KKE06_01030 [Candidatus Micrarchaeota archaeon]|nr:hypothetical protein [Candidatus Micrarchaeota archaeon]
MKRIVLFLRKRFLILVPILLAVLLWELLSLAAIFDPFLFPSFFPILERFFQLTVGLEILLDFASTIFKIVVALLVGSLGGLVIGVLLYKWNIIYDSVSPWLDFFRSIPATALFPLFLLFFGVGDSTNIALATWVCALYLSLHVSKGLRNAIKHA